MDKQARQIDEAIQNGSEKSGEGYSINENAVRFGIINQVLQMLKANLS
jgi:hypothetical protein